MSPHAGQGLWELRQWLRVAAGRLKAHAWRLQGARLGPKVTVGRGARLDRPWCLEAGGRVTLEPHVYLKATADDARLAIGEGTFVGYGAGINVLTSVRIGRHCLLAPRVFIVDHTHGLAPDRRIDEQPCVPAPIVIGDDVWIGAGAVILPGVSIGPGAVVGALALVRHDVPAGAVVAGVPARVIRYRAGQAEGRS